MSHYYDTQGKPVYEVPGNSGKLRATTIRDARKLKLQPSVTTITAILDKAGLINYFLKQTIAAVFSQDRQKEGESWEDYADRIIQASRQESQMAAKRGSELHNKLEEHYKKATKLASTDYDKMFIQPIIEEVTKLSSPSDDIIAEPSFSHQLGYGGKIDLVIYNKIGGIIIDFKTKNTTDKKKFYKYDEHLMQLAAYRHGIDMPDARCFDLYFSSIEPGILELHEWTEPELQKGWRMFQDLLSYWQTVNNYDSSFQEVTSDDAFSK